MISHHFRVSVIGILFSVMAPNVHAVYSIEENLKTFHSNPKVFMSNPKNLQKYQVQLKISQTDVKTGEPIGWEVIGETPISTSDTAFEKRFCPRKKYL